MSHESTADPQLRLYCVLCRHRAGSMDVGSTTRVRVSPSGEVVFLFCLIFPLRFFFFFLGRGKEWTVFYCRVNVLVLYL